MKTLVLLLGVLSMQAVLAAAFTEYPGAVFDKALTAKAQSTSDAAGTTMTTKVFSSTDSFEAVSAYYTKLGKEYKMPTRAQQLEDGTPIQKTFIIFDEAADLSTSKNWLAIQTPLIGDVEFKQGRPVFIDVRPKTTSILWVTKK